MQGNLVFNAAQELIYRQDLERTVVETAINFAAEHGAPSRSSTCLMSSTCPMIIVGHDCVVHAC